VHVLNGQPGFGCCEMLQGRKWGGGQ